MLGIGREYIAEAILYFDACKINRLSLFSAMCGLVIARFLYLNLQNKIEVKGKLFYGQESPEENFTNIDCRVTC